MRNDLADLYASLPPGIPGGVVARWSLADVARLHARRLYAIAARIGQDNDDPDWRLAAEFARRLRSRAFRLDDWASRR